MKNLFLLSLLMFSMQRAYSQVETSYDTLITRAGTTHVGKVIKAGSDIVQFLSPDSVTHNVPASFVKELKLARQAQISIVKTSSNKYDPNDIWSYPTLPRSIVNKHKTGKGLTIASLVLLPTGAILMGADSKNIYTASTPSYSGVFFRNGAAAGFLLSLGGVPMMIAGIVKWVQSEKKAKRFIQTEMKAKQNCEDNEPIKRF